MVRSPMKEVFPPICSAIMIHFFRNSFRAPPDVASESGSKAKQEPALAPVGEALRLVL